MSRLNCPNLPLASPSTFFNHRPAHIRYLPASGPLIMNTFLSFVAWLTLLILEHLP